MSAPFPIVPQNGISPIAFLLLAALLGLAFGWFLERSGFGSAKKLTAVFILRDFGVYRVMFTALLTTMIGVQLLAAVGLLDLGLLEISTTYMLAMTLGGLLFGAGFYLGGFCPGTAVVSFVRGRLDGLLFLVGIVLGIYGFALFFDGPGQASWFQNFYAPSNATVMSLLESPYVWFWVAGVTGAVLLSFRYLYIPEQRFSLRTPEELENDTPRPTVVKPKAGRTTRALVVLAGALIVILGILQIGNDEPEALAIGSEIPSAVAVDEDAVPLVDPVSLAGWVVADANRLADDMAPNSHVVDMRPLNERMEAPIRGPLLVCGSGDRDERYESTVVMLNDVLVGADRNMPLVVVDSAQSTIGRNLVTDLRLNGLNAMLLDGGSPAWRDMVLSPDAIWPEWTTDTATTDAPTVADYHEDVRLWMIGDTLAAPAYLPVPGTMQLPAEVATVAATGGGGGGCG